MSGLRSGTRLHEVAVDPDGRPAYGLDYDCAPQADLDLGPLGVVTLSVSSTIAGQGRPHRRARAAGAPQVHHRLRQNRSLDILQASL